MDALKLSPGSLKIPLPKSDILEMVVFTLPKGTDRKKAVSSVMDKTYSLFQPYMINDRPFIVIHSPCGEVFEVQNKEDMPLEDVPCTCGDKSHFFIKYKEEEDEG